MQFLLRLIIGDAQSNGAHVVKRKKVETLHYIVFFIVRKRQHLQSRFLI